MAIPNDFFSDDILETKGSATQNDYWYNKYFFSPFEVRVYLSLVGELQNVLAVQYQKTNSKTPVYGYDSTYFDFLAPGRVLIEGSIIYAFQFTDYVSVAYTQVEEYLNTPNISMASSLTSEVGGVLIQGEEGLGGTANGNPNAFRKDFGKAYYTERNNLNDRDDDKDHQILISHPWITNKKYVSRIDMKDLRRPAIILKNNQMVKAKTSSIGPGGDLYLYYGSSGRMTKAPKDDPDKHYGVEIFHDIHFTRINQILGPTGDPVAEQHDFFALSMNYEHPGPMNMDSGIKVYKDKIKPETQYSEPVPYYR